MHNAPDGTIDFKRLQQLTGYDRPGDVARELRRMHIKHFPGKRRVWTTVALINAAMGLKTGNNPPDGYSPDIL